MPKAVIAPTNVMTYLRQADALFPLYEAASQFMLQFLWVAFQHSFFYLLQFYQFLLVLATE